MIRGSLRALRFAYAWKRPPSGIRREEVSFPVGDDSDEIVRATRLDPRRSSPGPGWVVLHGLARTGREHPSLQKFAAAMVGSGATVLLPELPSWSALSLDPEAALPRIRAAIRWLSEQGGVRAGGVGLMGFSFGVPQALHIGAEPESARRLAGVAGFGGYCDLERTVRFLFDGRFEWEGEEYRLHPDPYGRWIVAGNLLRFVDRPGSAAVADALLELAREAGDLRIPSGDPRTDPMKERHRSRLDPEHRALFDHFAPAAAEEPVGGGEEWIEAMRPGFREHFPRLDPRPSAARVHLPVRLIHGRSDALIPFCESLDLPTYFPADADIEVGLTGLFSHSQGNRGVTWLDGAREGMDFLRKLRGVLSLTP